MLLVAEAADNTAYIGMPDYPKIQGLAEGKVALKNGSSFGQSSIQHNIVTNGFLAVQSCVIRFLKKAHARSSRTRTRKRGPGSALKLILKDFMLYDASRGGRHLPSASTDGGVSLQPGAGHACGLLLRGENALSVASQATSTLEKSKSEEAMTELVKMTFKYAKKVGHDLAKSLPPGAPQVSEKELAKAMMRPTSHSHPGERGGILQNLQRAIDLLTQKAIDFSDAKPLLGFLKTAVSRVKGRSQRLCHDKLGDESCHTTSAATRGSLVEKQRPPLSVGILEPHLTHTPLSVARGPMSTVSRGSSPKSTGSGSSHHWGRSAHLADAPTSASLRGSSLTSTGSSGSSPRGRSSKVKAVKNASGIRGIAPGLTRRPSFSGRFRPSFFLKKGAMASATGGSPQRLKPRGERTRATASSPGHQAPSFRDFLATTLPTARVGL